MGGGDDCSIPWGLDDQFSVDATDWAVWPSLDPRPWCRFGCWDSGCDCGGCLGPRLPSVPLPTPVTRPKFATGHDLWRLAMPRDISPDDARLEKGERGPIIKAGPLLELGGVLYSAAMEGVEVEQRSAPGSRFAIVLTGTKLIVDLETDAGGTVHTTPTEILIELANTDMADALIAYARPAHGASVASAAPAAKLPFPVGTLSFVIGAPSSTFSVVFECVRSGYLTQRPALGQLVLAQFRASLDNGRRWTMTRPYDDKQFEIESCGVWLRLADGGAPAGPPPFQKGMRWTMATTESRQIDEVLRAAAADMVRRIGVSEVLPLRRWEADLPAINAVLGASKLLRGPRGIDASPKASGGFQYDEEIAKREKAALADLDDIADAYQRLVCVASGTTYGVDAVSRAPQGRGMM